MLPETPLPYDVSALPVDAEAMVDGLDRKSVV